MSNVAKKTQRAAPPGPKGSKKGGESGDSANIPSSSQTPRSPPAVEEYQGFIRDDDAPASTAEETQGGEYTHKDAKEKGETGDEKGEAEEQEPIKMKDDNDTQPAEEAPDTSKLKDVEPQPQEEGEQKEKGEEEPEQEEQGEEKAEPEEKGEEAAEPKEKGEEEAEPEEEDEDYHTVKGGTVPDVEQRSERPDEEGEEEHDAHTDKTSDDKPTPSETGAKGFPLTEKAKKEFDQASENRSTKEAGGSLLGSARSKLSAPKSAKKGESQAEGEEEQSVPDVEAPEESEAPAEVDDKVQDTEKPLTEKAEDVTEDQGSKAEDVAEDQKSKAASETEEKAAETEEKAAETEEAVSEIEEKAAPELEDKTAEAEEKAPSEVEDKTAKTEKAIPETEEEGIPETEAAKTEETAAEGEEKAAPEDEEKAQLESQEEPAPETKEGEEAPAEEKSEDEEKAQLESQEEPAPETKEGEEAPAEEKPEDEEKAQLESQEEPAPETKEGEEAPSEEKSEDEEKAQLESQEEPAPETKEGEEAPSEEKAEDEEKAQLESQEEPAPETKEGDEAPSEEQPEEQAEQQPEEEKKEIDFSVLKDGTVNKMGNITTEDGKLVGRVTEGELKDLIGKKVDENGTIWSPSGKALGKAEPIPEDELKEMTRQAAPFEEFPDAVVDKDGTVVSNGEIVGKVVEGDPKELKGKSVDADGDILSKNGDVVGKAERWEPEEPQPEEPQPEEEKPDYSILKNGTVNKVGNVTSEDGKLVGRVIEGELKNLIGKKVDENGTIWSDSGKALGKAEPIPEDELKEMTRQAAPFEEFPDAVVDKDGTVVSNGEIVGKVIEGDPKELKGKSVDPDGDILNKNGDVVGKAERWEPEEPQLEEKPDYSILKNGIVNKVGNVTSEDGKLVGRVIEGELKNLIGKKVDENGTIWSDSGKALGKAEPIPEDELKQITREAAPFEDFPGAVVDKDGMVVSADGEVIGKVIEGDPKELRGKSVDQDGDILSKGGDVIGKAERWEPEPEPEPEEEKPDTSILKNGTVNKLGNVTSEDGKLVGRVVEGALKQLIGKKVDENGVIWSSSGKPIGKAEPIPDNEREDMLREAAPFESFPDAVVDKDGMVVSNGEIVGKVVKGDPKVLRGKSVDPDGDILDKSGDVIGKAERWEPEPEPEEKVDYSILKNGTVNKLGNITSEDGRIVGRVIEGAIKNLIGRKVDENGTIWSSSGKAIGKAEPIPDDERESFREPAPFENFPDAVVDKDGMVVSNGDIVGRIIKGDAKELRGKSVDPEGDILSKGGDVIGKAERWEPEPEPEPEKVDKSILAGKRVNKLGNLVDSSGNIYGRVIEGDVKRMVGRMCDKEGRILSESGDVIGKADLVSEGEREGVKEGPFADLQGCTVAKDGTVVTPSGDIVGRLVSGDPKVLFGRAVDQDGDVLDSNGNSIGKAERWQPEEVEHKKNPMSGRKVNREGNVVDEEGNIIGKLTSGDLNVCNGKEIDDDGDVVDYKGNTIGHCSLLEDIPPEEEPVEEETEEERKKREEEEKKQAEEEERRKLAKQMAVVVDQCLDNIRPICKMITEKIEAAERTPEDERDEEALVREVRPLIEEGGRILNEAKGSIKGLDPDGRIAANAKHKTAAGEASPEEYRLADLLKELTGDVTQCIENAKKKLEGMPHAKKELNPLWGLLNEPLFQILAAVGLLLAGVLNLVGRLLSGLGLGGIIDGLLGTLGLNRVLAGLGLGELSKGLKSGGKKKGGGLLGGLLGG